MQRCFMTHLTEAPRDLPAYHAATSSETLLTRLHRVFDLGRHLIRIETGASIGPRQYGCT